MKHIVILLILVVPGLLPVRFVLIKILAPTLKQMHPEVKLYLGTFNTNRQDHVETILADTALCNLYSWYGISMGRT